MITCTTKQFLRRCESSIVKRTICGSGGNSDILVPSDPSGTYISVFDMFKIGVGPSSSHTFGPMNACTIFSQALVQEKLIDKVDKIDVELYGSLCLTGKGHCTPEALAAGLAGYKPETIEGNLGDLVHDITKSNRLKLAGVKTIHFGMDKNIHFKYDDLDYDHPNTFKIIASGDNNIIYEKTYVSLGGGFIKDLEEDDNDIDNDAPNVPFFFTSGKKLWEYCDENELNISDIMLQNELVSYSRQEVNNKLDTVFKVMNESIERGIKSKMEYLPGPLKVKRNAPSLYKNLKVKQKSLYHYDTIQNVNMYAISCMEENASGSRIATSPTMGSAGIIPAVMKYCFEIVLPNSNLTISPLGLEKALRDGPRNFLLTAGAIGTLFKRNASISGAEVGCQGEVGVAASMAAAALTEILGGTPNQVLNAAEIAMEHSLGLTCDPPLGLVQIPCIERNCIGANKAINSAILALEYGDKSQHVSFDQIVRVMLETGKNMREEYKETSLGGLGKEFSKFHISKADTFC